MTRTSIGTATRNASITREGSGTAFEKESAEMHVLLILVFGTDKYNEQQGTDSYRECMQLMH